MDSFISLAHKMSSNRYLSAIRDGFAIALPLTLAASFAILINNVILANNLPYALANPAYYNAQFIEVIQTIKFVFISIAFGGLGWLTPLVLMGIAYSLSEDAQAEKPFMNALIILGAFLALLPKGGLLTDGYWQNQWIDGIHAHADGISAVTLSGIFSGANLFTALLVGIIFTEILLKLQAAKKLKIALPKETSSIVASAFSSLIPAFITIALSSAVAALFMYFKPLGFADISSFISGLIQEPFLAVARVGLGGLALLVIYVFFANFLWVFGLHGSNILAGLAGPTLMTLSLNNQAFYAQTGDAFAPELATFTMGFVDAYTQYGGPGATLGLLIAIYIISKREDYRAISKVATAPGIFEINEPLTFGLPIVLNPILGIPFILAPLISILLPAILTLMGWLPKVVVAIPWVVPPVLNSFLATGASWRAAFVGIINIVLITLVYLPFVMITNKAAETTPVERVTAMSGVKNVIAKVMKKPTLKVKAKEKVRIKKMPAAVAAKKELAKSNVTAPTKAIASKKTAPKTTAKPKPKAKPVAKKPVMKPNTKEVTAKRN